MKYDFDEVIDRSANRSAKYDERIKKFGTDDVLPLWVADMDFRTAQPIIDACKAKAEEGIWGYTSRPDSCFEAVQNFSGGFRFYDAVANDRRLMEAATACGMDRR